MPYCVPADLLLGDMLLSSKYGDGSAFVGLAADEIDAQIGNLYVTPVVIPDTPRNRPSLLLLKKINTLLASGRIVMDQAIGGEDRSLQAYGKSLIDEAVMLLNKISNKEIILIGAEEHEDVGDDPNTAISISNEDDVSLVESFYSRNQTVTLNPKPIFFYGGNV